jgi:hypothetical protein
MTNHDADMDGGAWAVVCGALIGAAAGYVFGTRNGRRLYDNVVHMLEDLSSEGPRFFQAAARARTAAVDSWNALAGGVRTMEPNDRVVGH